MVSFSEVLLVHLTPPSPQIDQGWLHCSPIQNGATLGQEVCHWSDHQVEIKVDR